MQPVDERHVRRALELACAAVREGTGGPFGAVVVRGAEVLGEGQNRVLQTCDPTAHAEVNAIRDACRHVGDPHLAGCVLVASCEPCPLCLAAAMWARVDAVWYAATAADAAAAGFDDAVFWRELALPAPERTLPVRRLPGADASAAFALWTADPARRIY